MGQRCSLASITSSTSCTASVHLCIGTSAKAWKRENSARLAKILRLWRKTTRRWVSRLQKEKVKKKAMATSFRRALWLRLCFVIIKQKFCEVAAQHSPAVDSLILLQLR